MAFEMMQKADDKKDMEEMPAVSSFQEEPSEITESSKTTLRGIDIYLLPLLIGTYTLQFLDKSSLGSATILGIVQDTKLAGQELSWLNSAFYFGYLVANYPVSVILVKLPLGKTVAASVLVWAVVLACHGAAHNFVALCVLRVLLGIFESTISPGFTLITGLWYKPSEHAARHGTWFLGNSLGNLCGALIAYGCSFIIGGPLKPWKWLFVILGIITAFWGLLLLLVLPDSPSTAWFLSPEQRAFATQRPQQAQRSFKTNKWSHAHFIEALKDPKTWFQFAIITVASLSNGVVSNFFSLIIQSLGYDTRQTLLLGMPLGCFQFIAVLISFVLASKLRRSRCLIVVGGHIAALLGVLLIRHLPRAMKGGRFAGVMLLTASSNLFPLMLSLISSNVAGFTKKATVNAIFFVGYGIGNIAGPQFFVPAESPAYQTAITALLAIYCIDIGMIVAFRQYLQWENKRRDRAQGKYIDPEFEGGNAPLSEVMGEVDETDWENVNFRYYI